MTFLNINCIKTCQREQKKFYNICYMQNAANFVIFRGGWETGKEPIHVLSTF